MSIVVLHSGPLLTVQDSGRWGVRHLGVPASGALDWFAYSVAQRLVGNTGTEAALEITAGGCVLRATDWCVIAVAGGDLQAHVNDRPLPLWCACLIRPQAMISFEQRRQGARAYLAVAGGFDVPRVLGSRSALIGGPFPNVLGRVLRTGDQLAIPTPQPLALAGRRWPDAARPDCAEIPSLHYIPGPHHHLFAADVHERVQTTTWRVSSNSNRMGFRLKGPPLPVSEQTIASLGVVPGVIQVPPNGEPIILLADAQTTGGYPILGTVITADLPRIAQLLPEDVCYLRPTTLDVAQQAWRNLLELMQHPFDTDDSVLVVF